MATTPTYMMKSIKMIMKMTPNDPIFMKICMSFLLHRMIKTTKRNKAQYEVEKLVKLGSRFNSGVLPEIHE